MKRKQNTAGSPRMFACQELEGRRLLAIDINVGTHNLLPNTPGQVIEITATSDDPANDLVTAMNLDAQLGNGDLAPNTGNDEPDFTDVEFLGGTVWDGQPAVTIDPQPTTDAPETGDSGEPSYLSASIVLGNATTCQADPDTGENDCDFAPNGVLARLTIDTTGFFSGTFPLLLVGGDSLMTNFSESLTGNTITPNITNGSITIVNSAPNADPVVSPADQYTIDFGGSLALNGSESSDPDQPQGDSIVSYEWDINSATFGSADATGVSPTLTWSQLNDEGITTPGTYDVTLRVTDSLGGTDTATVDLVVNPATVEGRHVFYNDSFWDGDDASLNASDDSAIAPSPDDLIALSEDPALGKTALLPGQTASFQNYTSFEEGINGIMVDVSIADSVTLSDFTFRVGNNGFPGTSTAAPAPLDFSIRSGDGTNGSDRITITWQNEAILKQWLEVTMLANSNTGLQSNEVHYWGNAVGETGNDPGNTAVNVFDRGAVATNQSGFFPPSIFSPYDMNRDRSVNVFDRGIVATNQSGFSPLSLFTAPSSFAGSSAAKFIGPIQLQENTASSQSFASTTSSEESVLDPSNEIDSDQSDELDAVFAEFGAMLENAKATEGEEANVCFPGKMNKDTSTLDEPLDS